ncbi:hypothetical protein PG997_002393 [Apiospora hydei]|uniref:Amine oxidase n=1 Tax=Apiospora hydei TaxID=1337664 RepID=A0ABR1X938_9PEZI
MAAFQLYLLLLAQSALAQPEQTYDAIIVGAGLSGLGAAKSLSEAGKTFLVLEARDRVGGRVLNHPLQDGGYTEVGAEFVGETQDKVLDLAAELGLELYPEYNTGDNVLYHQGERSAYASSPVPPVDALSTTQVLTVIAAINALVPGVDVQNPWNSTLAEHWDKKTFDEWLKPFLLTESARFLIDAAVETVFSVEADELSLLYALTYVAAAGNETTKGTFDRLISIDDGGAQQWRVDGGTQLLAINLAEKLGNDNVRLSAPVSKIAKTDDESYTVTLKDGSTVKGAHVVVAMSPPLARQITYEPALPAARDQLTAQMRMGSIGKAIAVYETSWWREEAHGSLTGQAVSDSGLARSTFDQSLREGHNPPVSALMTFLEADQMREYDNKTEAEITEQVGKDFVAYFGDSAGEVKEWVVQRWDLEEYSQGGPVAIAGPGTYTNYGPALKQRVGNLHFAGTESSDYWIGYMDGALRSGYRAAAEIIEG